MEESRINLMLSGVGTASGGVYQNVSIQGVGKVHGDIQCVDCVIEGVATIYGGIRSQSISAKGKINVEGDVAGDEINLEGRVHVTGTCTAEKITGTGSLAISGLLNAGDIHIQLFGPSRITEIGAETIRVVKESRKSIFGRYKTLTVQTIEGDEIYLENTKATVVRGNRIVIGPGCQVETVEYRTHLDCHKRARISSEKQV